MKLNYVGKRIGEYRRQLNISQATLAEQVGVSSKYISAVETGHEIPALDTIIAIADILQQTPNSIFGADGQKYFTIRIRFGLRWKNARNKNSAKASRIAVKPKRISQPSGYFCYLFK